MQQSDETQGPSAEQKTPKKRQGSPSRSEKKQSKLIRLRSKQFCAEAESFPSDDLLAYLSDVEGMFYMRFCSVPDAEGKLPPPQLLKHGKPWKGRCLIFFNHSTKNGLSKSMWERVATCLVLEPRPINYKGRVYQWVTFMESLDPSDSRREELKENIICTRMRNAKEPLPGRMSPTSAAAAAIEQEEALAAATQQAERACEEAEAAAAEAAEKGGLTEEDKQAIKRLSLQVTLQYVAKKCEQEGAEFLAGQPSRRRQKGKPRSLKSKKPEHVNARAKGEAPAAGDEQAGAAAGKKGKTVSFEAEISAALPQLSLAQKVVHRALPQPAGDEWKYEVVTFLQSLNAYARGRSKGGLAVSTLRSLLPQDCAVSPFFHTRCKVGLGRLFPASEKAGQEGWPSALELHRLTLRLEGLAESLGRECCLDQDGALLAGRERAFRRHYLVCDEVTWCMPYLAKLFFLRSRIHAVSQGELRAAFESVTKFRFCAVRADVAPLAEYARGVLRHAQRLAEVASEKGLHQAASAARQTLAVASAALDRAPPPGEADPEVVRCRLDDEAREARSILRDLGLEHSPVLNDAGRLRAALAEAMLQDSHGKQATRHLHPSPSLPDAVYDPQKYLRRV